MEDHQQDLYHGIEAARQELSRFPGTSLPGEATPPREDVRRLDREFTEGRMVSIGGVYRTIDSMPVNPTGIGFVGVDTYFALGIGYGPQTHHETSVIFAE